MPYLKKIGEILVTIFKVYHYSAVRQAGLEEIQDIMNDPRLKFKLPSATMWLSHSQAVNVLFVSIDRRASERRDATTLGLVTLGKSYKFVATLILMSDVLSHFNKLFFSISKGNH